MVTKVCPGSLLSFRSAPEMGLWTVIAHRVVRYPGPWEQFEMLLLNQASLLPLSIERSAFFRLWDVVHHHR